MSGLTWRWWKVNIVRDEPQGVITFQEELRGLDLLPDVQPGTQST